MMMKMTNWNSNKMNPLNRRYQLAVPSPLYFLHQVNPSYNQSHHRTLLSKNKHYPRLPHLDLWIQPGQWQAHLLVVMLVKSPQPLLEKLLNKLLKENDNLSFGTNLLPVRISNNNVIKSHNHCLRFFPILSL